MNSDLRPKEWAGTHHRSPLRERSHALGGITPDRKIAAASAISNFGDENQSGDA